MKTLLFLCAVVLALIVLAALLWRRISLQHLAPCPAQFSWMLENPYIRRVAGASMLLNRLGVREGMTLLDVGCGPGRITLPAALAVGGNGRVLALDLQKTMLDRVRKRADEMHVTNVEFIHAGMGENTLPAECCDRAIIVTVLGEIPDKQSALRGIFTALRPGGMLCVCEVLPDPHYLPRKRVEAMGRGAGFEPGAYHGGWCSYSQIFVKPESPA